jgi:hypothetical protein
MAKAQGDKNNYSADVEFPKFVPSPSSLEGELTLNRDSVLSSVPMEVMLLIVQFLPAKDLFVGFGHTSRWCRAVSRDQTLWSSLFIKEFGPLPGKHDQQNLDYCPLYWKERSQRPLYLRYQYVQRALHLICEHGISVEGPFRSSREPLDTDVQRILKQIDSG